MCRFLILLLVLSLPTLSHAQQAELVKNIADEALIDPYQVGGDNYPIDTYPTELTDANGILYFSALGEPWKSDGTLEGTVMIKNIRSNGASSPRYYTYSNGLVYFSAYEDGYGSELWKSDGTAEGTVLVADIVPGKDSSTPQHLVDVNGTLYFTAYSEGLGYELWKSDGTVEGTVLVADILSGASSSNPQYLTNVNGTLYFSAYDNEHGYELWKSNGTAEGTVLVADIRSGSLASNPQLLISSNGLLYFRASDGNHGEELWKSDGTAEGTVLVADIRPGADSSKPGFLTNVEGTVFFRANDGVTGPELWKSNGTLEGTTLVKDISKRSLSYLTNADGTLYFIAGSSLWKSDGTTEGTTEIIKSSEINWYNPEYLTFSNGILYLNTYNQEHGYELWKSDGTPENTVLVKDIRAGLDSDPSYLTDAKGTLYFSAATNRGNDGITQHQLWRSDGTAEGTVLVKPSSVIATYELTEAGGIIYFEGEGDLWKSDGTAEGTVLLKDLGGTYPYELTDVDGTLFFGSQNELWKSDGTTEGTIRVKSRTNGFGGLRDLTNVDGVLYFSAGDHTSGRELWRSDGTLEGTVLVKDIRPGSNPSDPQHLANVDGTLYFSANDGISGRELWKSDGTPEGTQLVADILPGNRSSNPSFLAGLNGAVYFGAETDAYGRELWKSDGTPEGTKLVKDIRSGQYWSTPQQLTSANGRLYFSANDGNYGDELWTSDGTSAGTVLLADIQPGPPSSYPTWITSSGSTLFFNVRDLAIGKELYKIDISPACSPPELVSTTPTPPTLINQKVSVKAKFADATFTSAVWHWGDGSSSPATIKKKKIIGKHTYTNVGMYTVTLEVTDACGTTLSYPYPEPVIIINPKAGFVTGAGRINSPPGAYVSASSSQSNVSFSFVSKYKKSSPKKKKPLQLTGKTVLKIKAHKKKFKSNSYQWLIVDNNVAQFQGEGKINGKGKYGFMLSVVDGDMEGGDGSDRLRIKIWDKQAKNKVVYDNQLGDSDNATAMHPIEKGNIVIHLSKGEHTREEKVANKPLASSSSLLETDPALPGSFRWNVFPNPLQEQLFVHIDSRVAEEATLIVYDMLGRKLLQQSKMLRPGTNQIQLPRVEQWADNNRQLLLQVQLPSQGSQQIKLLRP